jgi:hypothetical protein
MCATIYSQLLANCVPATAYSLARPRHACTGERAPPHPPGSLTTCCVALPFQISNSQLDDSITSIARYLRPRSGRLLVQEPLPIHLQRRLGLQLVTAVTNVQRRACPLSTGCALYAYHT